MFSTTRPAVNEFKNRDPQTVYLMVNPMGHGYHRLKAGFAGSGILFFFSYYFYKYILGPKGLNHSAGFKNGMYVVHVHTQFLNIHQLEQT